MYKGLFLWQPAGEAWGNDQKSSGTELFARNDCIIMAVQDIAGTLRLKKTSPGQFFELVRGFSHLPMDFPAFLEDSQSQTLNSQNSQSSMCELLQATELASQPEMPDVTEDSSGSLCRLMLSQFLGLAAEYVLNSTTPES